MAEQRRGPGRRGVSVCCLAASLAMVATMGTACKSGTDRKQTPGPVSASASVSTSASGSVVVHTLSTRTDNVLDIFRSTPAGPASAPPTGSTSGGSLAAQPFPGVPTVGAIFLDAGNVASIHYCTASVVHSASGDLIATAAHCVYNKLFGGYQNHILFVPGYHDETAPHGTWAATTAVLDQRWIASEDPDADVAFLTVRRIGGGTGSLESVTGANRFQADAPYTGTADVIAYPLGAEQPISCRNHTSEQSATQLRFDCDGFRDGSSGAPFLTADGALVGVLGGYEQGGSTPKTSYSSYFGARINALYQAAAGRA